MAPRIRRTAVPRQGTYPIPEKQKAALFASEGFQKGLALMNSLPQPSVEASTPEVNRIRDEKAANGFYLDKFLKDNAIVVEDSDVREDILEPVFPADPTLRDFEETASPHLQATTVEHNIPFRHDIVPETFDEPGIKTAFETKVYLKDGKKEHELKMPTKKMKANPLEEKGNECRAMLAAYDKEDEEKQRKFEEEPGYHPDKTESPPPAVTSKRKNLLSLAPRPDIESYMRAVEGKKILKEAQEESLMARLGIDERERVRELAKVHKMINPGFNENLMEGEIFGVVGGYKHRDFIEDDDDHTARARPVLNAPAPATV